MKSFAGWVYTGKSKEKAFLQDKFPTSENKYPPFIERIMRRRGIKKDEFESFLNPKKENLFPYHRWENLNKAIELIHWAVKGKKKIHIHSDYDVDGITSLSMLCAGIRQFGGDFSYTISNRFKGGYGIPEEIVENCFNNRCELFVSLDCGTSSFSIHERLKRFKIPTLIIDHHPLLEKPEPWVNLCNTHLKDCPEALSKLSSAGIVFKLLEGLYDSFNSKFPYNSFLRLTALGLAQDIVEMLGENHSLVSLGMKEIPST
ncbi:MAG: DHH family phosphoesterase, partial [Thermoanaerobaculia bacterium]